MNKKEKITEFVFGKTFKEYNYNEIAEFIKPFYSRFRNIDLQELFHNKRCFDAGCGSGRGSIFMLFNGATSVDSYDFSLDNVNTTERNISSFDCSSRSKVKQGSLLDISYYPNNHFDFVWCNGVLHHTKDPFKALTEIVRILKPGGRLWLYLYGARGIYWNMVGKIRSVLHDKQPQHVLNILRSLGVSTNKIAEFMDDWCVGFIETYENNDVVDICKSVGLDVHRIFDGTSYDTSERINKFNSGVHRVLMGEGDLRYLCTKEEEIDNIKEAKFSSVDLIDDVFYEFNDLFDKKTKVCASNMELVSFFVELQTYLRQLFSVDREIFYEEILDKLESL